MGVTLQNIAHDQRRHVYRTARWRRLRSHILTRDGYACRACLREGRGVRAARIVHHVQPVRQAPERAFDVRNLESVCFTCHRSKHEQEIVPDPTQRAWNHFYRELLPAQP